MIYCIIVPHYNHQRQFAEFLPKLIATGLPCIIVDDGSDSNNLDKLRRKIAEKNLVEKPQLMLFEHQYNRGKGAAVITACFHARAKGFTHAIQIDADGQHCAEDIEKFVSESQKNPKVLICGKPVFDDSAPKARRYGRKITDFWVALETLSLQIKDGLCGFRVYPLEQFEQVLDANYVGKRMAFDTEILVKACWQNIALHYLSTAVKYPEKSVSHFNYIGDNLELICLHTRLMFGMFRRFPVLLFRLFRRIFSTPKTGCGQYE